MGRPVKIKLLYKKNELVTQTENVPCGLVIQNK